MKRAKEPGSQTLQERLRDFLSDDLVRVEVCMKKELSCDGLTPPVNEILGELLSSPGKQLRPMLALLAGRAMNASETQMQRITHLAALLEIVHLASLVHDDVVDDAPLRRNMPTVQAVYGKNTAVYTGDFLLSRVLTALLRDGLNRSGEEIAKAVEAMCLGETAQMQARFDPDTTKEQYLSFIRGKTVALFVAAFKIAGIECGADARALDSLTELGSCFGYAFQLRDDLKDYVSSMEAEGKAVHADIRAGYYTLPLLRALETDQKSELRTLLKHASTEQEPDAETSLLRVMELVGQTDAFSYTEEQLRAYATRALALLEACADTPAKERIGDVITWLIGDA